MSPARKAHLMPWFEGCIAVFLPEQWRQMAQLIHQKPYELPESRRSWRQLFNFAEKATFDRQWRMVIPREMLQDAQVQKELVIAGSYDHLEIWSPERWQKNVEGQRTLESDMQKTYGGTSTPPSRTAPPEGTAQQGR